VWPQWPPGNRIPRLNSQEKPSEDDSKRPRVPFKGLLRKLSQGIRLPGVAPARTLAPKATPSRGGSLAAAATLLATAAPAFPATLNDVRPLAGNNTTLIIVELSDIVDFKVRRAPARRHLGVPERVQIDLQQTRLRANLSPPASLSLGPVKRVRAAQPSSNSTRILIDIEDNAEFGAVPMTDPFRLVINVHRPAAAELPAEIVLRPAPPRAAERTDKPPPVLRAPPRFKIVLDPGHGGSDPGAVGIGGVSEKDIVLKIAQELARRLNARPEFDVVLTRDDDATVPLEERTARANLEEADLFVSIHANASESGNSAGTETYYLNNTKDRATLRLAEMENGLRSVVGRGGPHDDARLILSSLVQNYKVEESLMLAENVQGALVAALKDAGASPRDLGVKRGPFYVLVGAGMPCILVEVSFITHQREGRLLSEAWYQRAIARGLLRGIERFAENAREARNL
jgi:N-acetylmuramoyl-L-alanine amidase